MALKDWPERIRYSWTDEAAGTPFSLTFDNPASAIAFIISQRNNLVDAESLLASLSDADTGESLAAPTNSASVDDIDGVATGQGVTLPEPEPSDDYKDPIADDDEYSIPNDEYTPPQSTDTTATANILGTGRPTSDAGEVPPSNIETPQATSPTPTEVVTNGYVGTEGATPTVSDDAPSESLPDASAPSSADGTADDAVPAERQPADPFKFDAPDESSVHDDEEATSDALYAPETPKTTTEHDDEDDDFDSDVRHDDEPEDADNAPSIGQPTTDTPGVTGV